MRIFVGILAALSVYGAVEFVRVRRLTARSKTLEEVAVGKRELGSGPMFRLFVVGDSAGAGTGASTFRTSVAGRLAERFAQEHTVLYRNVARRGARAADLLEQPLPEEPQDLLVVIVGSNDLVHLTGVGNLEEAIQTVLGRYRPLARRVVVVGPGVVQEAAAVPLVGRPLYAWLRPAYIAAMKRACSAFAQVIFVDPADVSEEFATRYGDPVSPVDHFHLDDDGHRWWADRILSSLPSQPVLPVAQP